MPAGGDSPKRTSAIAPPNACPGSPMSSTHGTRSSQGSSHLVRVRVRVRVKVRVRVRVRVRVSVRVGVRVRVRVRR